MKLMHKIGTAAKVFAAYVLSCALLLSLSACGESAEKAALEQQNSALLAENAELKARLAELEQAEPEEKTLTVSGSFRAYVHDRIPEYSYDSHTPLMALVSQFQSAPFLILLGPDMIDQVEAGKYYEFKVIDTEIDAGQYPDPYFMLNPVIFLNMRAGLAPIESITEVEDSGGCSGPHLHFLEEAPE